MLNAIRALERAVLTLIAIESERTRIERRAEGHTNRRMDLWNREESLTNSADSLISAVSELEKTINNQKAEAIGVTD